MPYHPVLLGDSIFDNAAYVEGKPDIIAQLRSKLPVGSPATLLAVDGAKAEDAIVQLKHIPQDATHLFLSAGGNNALAQASILEGTATSVSEVLARFVALGKEFQQQYSAMLQSVLGVGLPTTVCTIYYPNFSELRYRELASAALSFFNEVILREASFARLPIIDLRQIFSEPEDYANAIEPSERGGEKLTKVMLDVLEKYDFKSGRVELFF
ncbi:SGNH/GDSL hydrolase family protein [Oscillatoria sp. FACHB-1406]|uniref:SGNH/GDSL hydrolase family protein n=1 Tax=Oscillatoria sp. FACHB-1406 TaxID=2692846 RepID=UPI00168536AF|nr:SGNH/GDSL hydrolase family protein [Oscillatoria sp. FACHB-1406]MBD2579674.1 SGNH/GDSL hydrolase family protein [Oscillatoria sp. FACHB-1406]